MNTSEKTLRENLKTFKIHYLNTMIQMKKDLKNLQEEKELVKSLEDLLTVKEVMEVFKISRKTFDRWRIDGLKVYQKKSKAVITVQRKAVINYLKNK